MKKQPKLSILIPCYNVEKYIRQCMDSVVNQTLKDIEIIAINDGSKDNTLSILKDYAKNDKRIIIIDKANSGYGDSMNQGLKKATGEYIGIVESDDFVELNMFETLYNIASDKALDVVKSNFYYYWSKTGENKKVEVMPTTQINKIINPQIENGIFWSMPCIWAAIYKRDFLHKNNIRFLETPGASYQDTAFNFKVWASAHQVSFTDQAFLHYRQDNEQSSVNSKKKTFCICDEYQEIEKFIMERSLTQLLPLMQRLKWASYMWNFERLIWPLNWQFLKVMRKEFMSAKEKGLIVKGLFENRQYKKLKKLIKHPILFFIKAQMRKTLKKEN